VKEAQILQVGLAGVGGSPRKPSYPRLPATLSVLRIDNKKLD
jgi:hypothetical protein